MVSSSSTSSSRDTSPSPEPPHASSPSPPPSPTLEPVLDVGVESFYEWVVDRTQLKAPLPPVDGWTLTTTLRAYNERKLYTLNTAHCITAYLGCLRGHATIDAAIADPAIEAAVRGALAESGAALCAKHGFAPAEHAAYVEKTLRRFRNPAVRDDVARVGRQPLRKLGRADRLVGPARMCAAHGVAPPHLLAGVAAALLYDVPGDEQAAALRADIAAKGLAPTVADVTGFEEGGAEVRAVLEAYERLRASA
jgi:mannitol-1-phosphate 5-dehydrogenase